MTSSIVCGQFVAMRTANGGGITKTCEQIANFHCLVFDLAPTHRDTLPPLTPFHSVLRNFPLTQIPVLLNIALKECEFAQVGQFAWNCVWIWWAPKIDLQTQAMQQAWPRLYLT